MSRACTSTRFLDSATSCKVQGASGAAGGGRSTPGSTALQVGQVLCPDVNHWFIQSVWNEWLQASVLVDSVAVISSQQIAHRFSASSAGAGAVGPA